MSRALATASFIGLLALTAHSQPAPEAGVAGLREPAWSPDGKRLAVVYLDRLLTVAPDGRQPTPFGPEPGAPQREPAWSADGRIAFAMDRGDGFDLYVGPRADRVTSMAGDERTPSWTPDGRIVFSHRADGAMQWDLYVVAPSAQGWGAPERLTDTDDDELQPRVSPDGRRVAYASDRDSEDGDVDIWIAALPGRRADGETAASGPPRALAPFRLVRARGLDGHPAWSPDGGRIAFYAVRDGAASTWVASVDAARAEKESARAQPPQRPAAGPVLVSRYGGAVAWSPDGSLLAIGVMPDPVSSYNGNPHRDLRDPPPAFGVGRAYQLWTIPAPRAVEEGSRAVAPAVAAAPAALLQTFDRIWSSLETLYFGRGPGAAEWEALRGRYRPLAARARSVGALEDIVDRMIAEQPLVKPPVVSSRAVVVSGHPLASEAGRLVLERGGNIVDAAIAVSFALGVVEPDASGIGGDGQAVLYLTGMTQPTVVEYKDQTPMRATLDNPRVFRDGRLVGDGASAANIPGVVAGMEYLHRKYGSGRMPWAELIEPAIGYAAEGFVLDEALPSTIRAGRQYFAKHGEAARIYLPGGRMPKAGDRFMNRDYADTLRILARDGADAFYRGSIARSIAADMEANGGILTFDDLAQYHAIERTAVMGRYRGHALFAGGPPVATGVSLIEAFQIFGHYRPASGAMPAHDADYWHHMIESWKVRDRLRRIADPAHWPVDYDVHLEPGHAQELFRRIDASKAGRFAEESDDPEGESRIGRGTTAFVVADAEGNMISVTQTLSTWGGSFYVSRGLGFLYNNHLRANRVTRGAYGQLLPLTRSSTTSVPTLIFSDDGTTRRPRMAIGVAGNAWIPSSAYSTIAAVIDGGLSIQRAIEAPRFLVGRDPSDGAGTGARVEIEDRFPRVTLEALMQRGHRFQKVGGKGELRYGYAAAAVVDVSARRVEGASEPRRSHLAVAAGEPLTRTAERPARR